MARTVRVALWGGEEEGLYGSLAYVQKHFAPRDTMVKTPEYDNLDVYLTMTVAAVVPWCVDAWQRSAGNDLSLIDRTNP